jgi:hypothetical protein
MPETGSYFFCLPVRRNPFTLHTYLFFSLFPWLHTPFYPFTTITITIYSSFYVQTTLSRYHVPD